MRNEAILFFCNEEKHRLPGVFWKHDSVSGPLVRLRVSRKCDLIYLLFIVIDNFKLAHCGLCPSLHWNNHFIHVCTFF